MRQPSRVTNLERHAAGNLTLDAGIENVRIRRLQIRRDPEKVAGNRSDGGRRIRKRLEAIGTEFRRASCESWTRAEAIRVGEVRGRGQSDRTVLIVLRDEVAAEPVVNHAGAGAERARLSEQFPDEAAAVLWTVGEAEARREIQIAGFPPGRLAVRGSIEIPAQNGVRHCILRYAAALKIIARREVLLQRNRRRHLRSTCFVQWAEILIAHAEVQRQLAGCAIAVAGVCAIIALDE